MAFLDVVRQAQLYKKLSKGIIGRFLRFVNCRW